MLLNPSQQRIKRAKALHPKKGLSQNFLVDDKALTAIAAEFSGYPAPLPLVEIGPGPGFLTELLLETGHPMTAIEVDEDMVAELKRRWPEHPGLSVLLSDVRKVDLAPLLGARGLLVGNLPYHLTGPILFQIVGELADMRYPLRQQLEKAVIMVQKEVGERLIAKPGDSAYGQLTLQAQCWFDVSRVALVPRTAFFPAPKVDSMVVRLIPRTEAAVSCRDFTLLSRLIKIAFLHRRKTLFNNLRHSNLYPAELLKTEMTALGLSPEQRRPQEVSLEAFGALCDALHPDA